MKTTQKIPLQTQTFTDGDGNPLHDTRTVKDEINRLRRTGMHDAADRMEASCDDTAMNNGRYLEIDPVTGKPLPRDAKGPVEV